MSACASHVRTARRSTAWPFAGPAWLALACVLLACVFSTGPASASDLAPGTQWRSAADPTPRDLTAILTDAQRPLTRTRLEDGTTAPDPVPDPLLSAVGVPLPCGTPVARLAERALPEVGPERQLELARLVTRPNLAAPRVLRTALGALRHDLSAGSRHSLPAIDRDGNGLADALEALASDVEHATLRLTELTGWNGSFSGSIDVGATLYAEGFHSAIGAPTLVLPRQLDGPSRLRAVAHQVAHVALHELDPSLPVAWEEAVATFLAEAIVADAASEELAPLALLANAGQAAPRRALGSPGLLAARGDAAFLAYLDSRLPLPADWIGRVHERLSDSRLEAARDPELSPLTPVQALAVVLEENGLLLDEVVAAYLGWTLEDDLLRHQGGVRVDHEVVGLPTEITAPGSELPPLSQLRFGIDTPTAGGLSVQFDAVERAEAELFTLLDDGRLLRDELFPGVPVRLPGSQILRVVVQVRAPEPDSNAESWHVESGAEWSAESGEFSLELTELPDYPFAVAELAASSEIGRDGDPRIRLDWLTTSEEGLVGWHVERARRLAGPWQVATSAPFPPTSRPGWLASYAFVDSEVEPDARYHYRLIGVTEAGLVERSAPITVRTLPEGPRELRRALELR